MVATRNVHFVIAVGSCRIEHKIFRTRLHKTTFFFLNGGLNRNCITDQDVRSPIGARVESVTVVRIGEQAALAGTRKPRMMFRRAAGR